MNLSGFPRNYWKGFIVILIAYSIVQLLFFHPLFTVPSKLQEFRQLIRWLTITFIYLVGARVLRNTGEAWMVAIWHIIHIVMISFLLLVAAYEYGIGPVPYGVRSSVAPIIEFLISPVLYMGSGLIYTSIYKR